MIEVNGMAHDILTVSRWEKAFTLHGAHLVLPVWVDSNLKIY